MPKIIFGLFLFIHGSIHLMGFAKAYNYAAIPQLAKYISRTEGFFWLATAVLFFVADILFLAKKDSWTITCLVAVTFSLVLIINAWRDAKFGTVANVIIMTVAIATIAKIFNK